MWRWGGPIWADDTPCKEEGGTNQACDKNKQHDILASIAHDSARSVSFDTEESLPLLHDGAETVQIRDVRPFTAGYQRST
mmetsp:Transcript_14683/g.26846  ORF Transcript_14683/g.26846 Transcript_14683/m.26846 type:complete len:80 (+) Transcript_14683:283-522(+)